jgi:hypothetical protein
VGAGRVALAQAFADLAASGRRALASFLAAPPPAAEVARAAEELLAGVPGVTQAFVSRGAEQALARAKAVAAYLTAVAPDRGTRARLGWIAVSGEIDGSRRPVNISSLPYPQYDINVPVRGPSGAIVEVEARYAVISERPAPTPEPQIPPGDTVLLFIHGDGSRLEEVTPLVEPLLAAGRRDGRSYTILAVDLPSHGCSTMVDPLGAAFAGTPPWDNHAPDPPSRPPSYPVLEFLENFVVAFVAALDAKIHCAHQVVGPMGGSLGGNMCLRLARRQEPWIRQSIAWSPAAVWDSLADDAIKQAGPNHCSTEGHAPEVAGTRAAFLFDVFKASTSIGPIPIVLPQGDYWYRADWQPCKGRLLEAAQWERREVYCREYRQMHYRMDWEQLIYSYNDPDHGSHTPRYESFRSRLLLASGSMDNNSPSTQIYGSCLTLAQRLERTQTHGRTFFVEHTGHSIHDERPQLMAEQIDAFTAETLGGGRVALNAAGAPLVRFTGQVHDWSHPIAFAPGDAEKLVLLLLLTIQTGSDDLRGGAHPGDNVDATLRLASGGTLSFANLNAGHGWSNGSTHTVQLPLPEGTRGHRRRQLERQCRHRDGDRLGVAVGGSPAGAAELDRRGRQSARPLHGPGARLARRRRRDRRRRRQDRPVAGLEHSDRRGRPARRCSPRRQLRRRTHAPIGRAADGGQRQWWCELEERRDAPGNLAGAARDEVGRCHRGDVADAVRWWPRRRQLERQPRRAAGARRRLARFSISGPRPRTRTRSCRRISLRRSAAGVGPPARTRR